MKRNKGIIAYGTEEDRQKLAILSHFKNKTASDWIIHEIRKQYKEVFGDCIITLQK